MSKLFYVYKCSQDELSRHATMLGPEGEVRGSPRRPGVIATRLIASDAKRIAETHKASWTPELDYAG